MNHKKAIVMYFSTSGYTKQVAVEISKNLKCDIEEIRSPISFKGFFGYQKAIIHTVLKYKPPIKKLKHNLADYDLVIVGSPLWARNLASPIRSFLSMYKNQLKDVAFFSTQGSPYQGEQNLATLEDLPVLKKKTQLFLG